ncbi:MAG: short chain dehydrogenase [Bacteroidota bacterium]
MKILIIGGKGTIGKRVVSALASDHEVIIGGRKNADISVDISASSSIQNMYEEIAPLDAIICIGGEAKWARIEDLSEEDYYVGIRSKLMGQVNLVRQGLSFLNPNGCFILSTGILADDPVPMTTSAAMVNGAIHSFAQAAALELTDGKRINVVSLGLVADSAEKYKDYFPGHNPVPMNEAVNAYIKALKGRMNGQIIRHYR